MEISSGRALVCAGHTYTLNGPGGRPGPPASLALARQAGTERGTLGVWGEKKKRGLERIDAAHSRRKKSIGRRGEGNRAWENGTRRSELGAKLARTYTYMPAADGGARSRARSALRVCIGRCPLARAYLRHCIQRLKGFQFISTRVLFLLLILSMVERWAPPSLVDRIDQLLPWAA